MRSEKTKVSTNILFTPSILMMWLRENPKQISDSYLTPSYQSRLRLFELKIHCKLSNDWYGTGNSSTFKIVLMDVILNLNNADVRGCQKKSEEQFWWWKIETTNADEVPVDAEEVAIQVIKQLMGWHNLWKS